MSDFKEYTLGEICDRLSSGKGIPAKQIHDNAAYPVFGGNGLRGYTDRKNFEGECAIIGRQGAFCGNVRYYIGEAYMTEHAIVACTNANHSTRYLTYLLSTMNLGRLSGQSAQPGLSVKMLAKQLVSMPSKDQQDRVVSILSSIDTKIKQNSEINDNLEKIAFAYYRYLFVENRSAGWKECTISDLGSVVGGSTPSKAKPEYYADHAIAWITPKDLSINKSKFITHGENDISELGLRNSSAVLMPEGTVLFSSRAPIGYIAIAAGQLCTNQGFKSVIPAPHIGTAFVYYFLKDNLSTIEGMASGSTFKEVSGSTMKSVPAFIPDISSLNMFNTFCRPIFDKQRSLEEENRSWTDVRDSILPKLMSGELDISNLEL